jgi:hypothetical protein
MDKPLIIYLDIEENDMYSGLDAISFVSQPATEISWQTFSVQTDTYNDYPKSAKENACRAIKFRDSNPNVECGTRVGWTRANQLCNGENLSMDTIGRMASFKRHQQNKDVPYNEGCGGLMWDAWGGDEGINWAIRKMEWIHHNMSMGNMSKHIFQSDEKRIVTSPIMVAETPILRYHEIFGKYYVKFSEDTILKMMKKYFKENKINNVNEQHNPKKFIKDVYLVESFIVGDRVTSELYPDLPKGSWVGSFYIDDEEYWNKIKNTNEFTGFSLEGQFIEQYEEDMINKKFSEIEGIINSNMSDDDKEIKIKTILNL